VNNLEKLKLQMLLARSQSDRVAQQLELTSPPTSGFTFCACGVHAVDLSSVPLILPTFLSFGNAGQFAVDMWISNFHCEKIGQIESPQMLPLVGFSSGLVVALEVFYDVSHGVVLLQHRSSLRRGCSQSFANSLKLWIDSCKFKEVILLATSDAGLRVDDQLTGSQIRCIRSENTIRRPGWFPSESECTSQVFKAGSITQQLFEGLSTSGFDVVVLDMFCSEGNNIAQSVAMACSLVDFLGIQGVECSSWTFPNLTRENRGKALL